MKINNSKQRERQKLQRKKAEAKRKRIAAKDNANKRKAYAALKKTYKHKAEKLGISLDEYMKRFAPKKRSGYSSLGVGGKGLN